MGGVGLGASSIDQTTAVRGFQGLSTVSTVTYNIYYVKSDADGVCFHSPSSSLGLVHGPCAADVVAMSIQSLMALVTDLVTRLEEGSLEVGFHRSLHRGSAHGSVAVVQDPDDGQLMIVVRLSIMSAPAQSLKRFLATLLELNHRFHGRAAFSLDDLGLVHLSAGRPLADLDEGEVVDLILWTSQQADHYDDVLKQAFPQ